MKFPKGILPVLVLLAVVALVAAKNSQAAPLTQRASAAFTQCHAGGSQMIVACRALIDLTAGADNMHEVDFANDVGGGSDPEKKVGQFVKFIGQILQMAGEFLDQLSYGPVIGPAGTLAMDEVFDEGR